MTLEAGSVRVGRLVRSTDFERVLRVRSRAQSTHFALHHVMAQPSTSSRPLAKPDPGKLSTGDGILPIQPVDDSLGASAARATFDAPDPALSLWLGMVIPKRHARRAVTRALLKRQIRTAIVAHAGAMVGGLWVVRLRAAFERSIFTSAASIALRRAARAELDALLVRCAEPGRVAPGN